MSGNAQYHVSTSEPAIFHLCLRSDSNHCDVLAPLGLEDLFGMVLRPTLRFAEHKREVYETRIHAKGWLERWPCLRRME